LPQGMTLSSISFDSVQNQLVGKVEKGDSRLKSRREWASKGEARQSQWVEQQEQLRSPILLTAPWHDVEVGEFLQEAIDALELFGVDVK
ncbi:hypothetical protein AB4394_26610, partial [Vibrio lentus]